MLFGKLQKEGYVRAENSGTKSSDSAALQYQAPKLDAEPSITVEGKIVFKACSLFGLRQV